MIITQTPLRIGLVGGGTDLPDYYLEHGGRVLNCAIDKYVYVIVKQRFDDEIYVNYSKKEIVSKVDELEHELVREAMQMTGVSSGVEITMLGRYPLERFGARFFFVDHGRPFACPLGLPAPARPRRRAGRRCVRDRDRTLRQAHRQAGPVHSRPRRDPGHPLWPRRQSSRHRLGLSALERHTLQEQVMLFYTGVTRSATTILVEQSNNVATSLSGSHLLRDLAGSAVDRPAPRRCGRPWRRHASELGGKA